MKTLVPVLTSPPAAGLRQAQDRLPPLRALRGGPRGRGWTDVTAVHLEPTMDGSSTTFRRLPLGGEAVADVAHGLDEDARARLDLAAQTADVDVDGAGAAEVLVAPDTVEQRLAREHLAAVRHQKAQQLELLEREAHRLLADEDLVVRQVDHEVTAAQ